MVSKKKNKLIYEPPRGISLSDFTASGDDRGRVLGVCKSGTSPYYDCVVGNDFLGQCTPGGTPDTSVCSGGGYHLDPACGPGGNAATICLSGNGQN